MGSRERTLGRSGSRWAKSGWCGGGSLALVAITLTGIGRFARAISVSSGDYHTCSVLDDETVKCWGINEYGQLGLPQSASRGDEDNEMGDFLPRVDLGTGFIPGEVHAGGSHTCVVEALRRVVKCFGRNMAGQLGLEDDMDRGFLASSMGDALPEVDLGVNLTVTHMDAGAKHSCAVLSDGSIKCWGNGRFGKLGKESQSHIGLRSGDMGDLLLPVNLGTSVISTMVGTGDKHSCALLLTRDIKCWGRNNFGQLGLGDFNDRGDLVGSMGNVLPTVDLGMGVKATSIALGAEHTCALLVGGDVKCWGLNSSGQLGIGTGTVFIGGLATEMGDALPSVDLGMNRTAIDLVAGTAHTCALLDNDRIKCWGENSRGSLGQGDSDDRGQGNSDMGDNLPEVDLGVGRESVSMVSAGGEDTCVVTSGTSGELLLCFGSNDFGQLGQGDAQARGDEPLEMGNNLLPVDLGNLLTPAPTPPLYVETPEPTSAPITPSPTQVPSPVPTLNSATRAPVEVLPTPAPSTGEPVVAPIAPVVDAVRTIEQEDRGGSAGEMNVLVAALVTVPVVGAVAFFLFACARWRSKCRYKPSGAALSGDPGPVDCSGAGVGQNRGQGLGLEGRGGGVAGTYTNRGGHPNKDGDNDSTDNEVLADSSGDRGLLPSTSLVGDREVDVEGGGERGHHFAPAFSSGGRDIGIGTRGLDPTAPSTPSNGDGWKREIIAGTPQPPDLRLSQFAAASAQAPFRVALGSIPNTSSGYEMNSHDLPEGVLGGDSGASSSGGSGGRHSAHIMPHPGTPNPAPGPGPALVHGLGLTAGGLPLMEAGEGGMGKLPPPAFDSTGALVRRIHLEEQGHVSLVGGPVALGTVARGGGGDRGGGGAGGRAAWDGVASKTVSEIVKELEELQIDRADLTLVSGRPFALGRTSEVYQIIYKGKTRAAKVTDLFRIGVVNGHVNRLYEAFSREIRVMRGLKDSRLAEVYGAVATPTELTIVMELGKRGSLRAVLDSATKRNNLTPELRHGIIKDVAAGMAYLVQQGVPHGCLRSRNVLVTKEWRAKVADYGQLATKAAISRAGSTRRCNTDSGEMGDDRGAEGGGGGGTISTVRPSGYPWTAPEVLGAERPDNVPYSVASDVYSLGTVVWEVMCGGGRRPWQDMPSEKVKSLVLEGSTLPIQMECPTLYGKIMLLCWRQTPTLRPSFAKLFELMDKEMPVRAAD